MSVNLSIKGVSDALAAQLRARAERNHRSLQGELMAIIERAASGSDEPAAALRELPAARGERSIEQIGAALRAQFPSAARRVPAAVDILRELRDRR